MEPWQIDARRVLWIYGASCVLGLILYLWFLVQFAATRQPFWLVMLIGLALFHLLYWGRNGPIAIHKALYLLKDGMWKR